MPDIASTSGRFLSEFIRILFLQDHRETDRFFAASGVSSAQSPCGFFHYRRAAFFSNLKSKTGSLLAKAAALRITLNLDGAPITSKSHTHPSDGCICKLLGVFANFSSINLVSIFRCFSSTTNPVYARHVNSLVLVCSLSSHRHSYIHLIFSSSLS